MDSEEKKEPAAKLNITGQKRLDAADPFIDAIVKDRTQRINSEISLLTVIQKNLLEELKVLSSYENDDIVNASIRIHSFSIQISNVMKQISVLTELILQLRTVDVENIRWLQQECKRFETENKKLKEGLVTK